MVWDAMSVLSIINPNPDKHAMTCFGYAKTQKRRCWNIVNFNNRREIMSTLNRLSTQHPSERRMEEDLRRVAGLGLCGQWHKDQVDRVVAKWLECIRQERRRLRDEAVDPPERPRRPSRAERRETAQSENDDDIVERISALLRSDDVSSNTRREVLRMCEAMLRRPRTPPPDRSSRNSSRNSSRTSAITLVTPPATPAAPSSATTCPHGHVRRRPLAGDCVICTEPCSASAPEALVWCKAQCGHNVHRTCFEEWRQTSLQQRQQLRCVIW